MAGERLVVFACRRGTFRSRIAAALFNSEAPPGWRAVSAGVEPQGALSPRASALLDGSPAAKHLQQGPAQRLAPPAGARVISIDCDAPEAERWSLASGEEAPLRNELAGRVADLVRELREGPTA